MNLYQFHYYSPVYPIFASFVCIGIQNPLESLVLLVILNQNQMFVMKLIEPAHALSNFVRYELLNHQLDCQSNATMQY